jgi:hypothetical protein
MAPCAPLWPDKLRFGRAAAFILIAIRLDRGLPVESRRRSPAAWAACRPAGAA